MGLLKGEDFVVCPYCQEKIKEQEKSPRKVYAIDTGLSNTVGFNFSKNIGKLAENIVFLELKRKKNLDPGLELYYWKDEHHREVDFIIKERRKIKELIQVSWNVTSEKTKKRELRSLLKAMKELGKNSAVVITEDYESEEKIKKAKIKFIPLWKWLCGVT